MRSLRFGGKKKKKHLSVNVAVSGLGSHSVRRSGMLSLVMLKVAKITRQVLKCFYT